tara:strand:- start:2276 stop:2431 length:156 start_codon:yes stop_codon:yes gene_type:complete
MWVLVENRGKKTDFSQFYLFLGKFGDFWWFGTLFASRAFLLYPNPLDPHLP